MLVDMFMHAFSASARIPSGLAGFPLFNVMIAFLILSFLSLTVGHGGRVVERRVFGQRDRGSLRPGFETTCCRLKTWAILFIPLSGVYARGSKRSHTGKLKKPVVDSVLVISFSCDQL